MRRPGPSALPGTPPGLVPRVTADRRTRPDNRKEESPDSRAFSRTKQGRSMGQPEKAVQCSCLCSSGAGEGSRTRHFCVTARIFAVDTGFLRAVSSCIRYFQNLSGAAGFQAGTKVGTVLLYLYPRSTAARAAASAPSWSWWNSSVPGCPPSRQGM